MEIKIIEAVFISLQVSLLSTSLSLLVSIPLSAFLTIKKFYLKGLLISLINGLTAIPPVCAGLLCYMIVSRAGPLGWMGILYTPIAMVIAQFIIIVPIMISLILSNFQDEYPLLEEELRSYGAKMYDILKLLIIYKYRILLSISMIGFGRSISEYGAAVIVGGSIDHLTRNITATIAFETAKGNLFLALKLGAILIAISFMISILSRKKI